MRCSRRRYAASARSRSCSDRSRSARCSSCPLALFLDTPEWTTRALLLAPLVGILTLVGNYSGFMLVPDGVGLGRRADHRLRGRHRRGALAGRRRAGRPARAARAAARGRRRRARLARRGRGRQRRASCPRSIAALVWGFVLALSAPIAHDLGAGWAFLLVRGSAVVIMLPLALAAGRAAQGARRVVARGDLGRRRRGRLLRVRDRGRQRPGRGGRRARRAVRHRRRDRRRDVLRRAAAQAPGRGHRDRRASPWR